MTVPAVSETGDRSGEKNLWWRFNRFLERHLPEGLYPRSLIIVIAPMVLLQSLMIYFVLEQHWSEVTKQLSRSFVRDMAFVIAVHEKSDRSAQSMDELRELANRHLKLGFSIQTGDLPKVKEKPYFSLVEKKLSKYIGNRVVKPFWLDTLGRPGYVDARIQVDKGVVFRFLVPEKRVYASQTLVLLLSMAGSSLILIVVAIAFLRKQIVPIVRLAEAATNFGMGREVKDFYPSGAAEVRMAANAFLNMKARIARHVEQRTAMLAGVSHDLRTILTRFKLELAILGKNDTVDALKQDVNEMQGMLEGYMSFVRGAGGERPVQVDVGKLFELVRGDVERSGSTLHLHHHGKTLAKVKPDAFKRLVVNLVNNALRFGVRVELDYKIHDKFLWVYVDDDGPGVEKERREEVFRPFVRLDQSRNQNTTGTGLGLAIALDIAHAHGGDIKLEDSRLGGLRVVVQIPI